MVLTASSFSHGILDRLNIQEMAAIERLPRPALSNLAQHTVRVTNIAMMQKQSQDFWILVSFRFGSCLLTAWSISSIKLLTNGKGSDMNMGLLKNMFDLSRNGSRRFEHSLKEIEVIVQSCFPFFYAIFGDIGNQEDYNSSRRSASLYYGEVPRRNEALSFVC
jgi:hypothetical protein